MTRTRKVNKVSHVLSNVHRSWQQVLGKVLRNCAAVGIEAILQHCLGTIITSLAELGAVHNSSFIPNLRPHPTGTTCSHGKAQEAGGYRSGSQMLS